MKERPIIFNTEMVQAILDGRKTQTRRVVQLRPENKTRVGRKGAQAHIGSPEALSHCPYGQIGDWLYVRETWRYNSIGHLNLNTYIGVEYKNGHIKDHFISSVEQQKHSKRIDSLPEEKEFPWIPSIHMPKWAARIWLEVTNIRVERVQDITEDDAKAEGIEESAGVEWSEETWFKPYDAPKNWEWEREPAMGFKYAKDSFRTLWDSINKSRGFGWDVNPWVWVVEFRVMA